MQIIKFKTGGEELGSKVTAVPALGKNNNIRKYSNKWDPSKEDYFQINNEKNSASYEKYKALANNDDKVIFGRRLGRYKSYE